MVKKTTYSSLNQIYNEQNSYTLNLSFKDLVEPLTKEEKIKFQKENEKKPKLDPISLIMNLNKPRLETRLNEVKIDLAKQRHQEMKEFWNELNNKLKNFYF